MEDEESGVKGGSQGVLHGEREVIKNGGVQSHGEVNKDDSLAFFKKKSGKGKWIRKRVKKSGASTKCGTDHGRYDLGSSSRPKNRARNDDPFDLDGLFAKGIDGVVSENSESLDLNKPVGSEGGIPKAMGVVCVDLEAEKEATMEVGIKLGVYLEEYDREVVDPIQEEGIDGVEL